MRRLRPEPCRQFSPDVQKQQMVLARLDRAQDDEVRLRQRSGTDVRPEPGRRQRGGHRWRHRQLPGAREIFQVAQSRARIGDHARGAAQHAFHALAVLQLFARTAILGVGDRDQVVHQKDGPQPMAQQPRHHAVVLDAGVAQVEVDAVAALLRRPGRHASPRDDQRGIAREAACRRLQQREQLLRCFVAHDATPAAPLQNSLGARAEMRDVGQADPIHTRRHSAPGRARHQAADVDQDGALQRASRSWCYWPRLRTVTTGTTTDDTMFRNFCSSAAGALETYSTSRLRIGKSCATKNIAGSFRSTL